MTFSTPQNFFYSGGIWDMSWLEWIWQNIAPDARAKKKLPTPGPDTASWKALGDTLLKTLPLDRVRELRDVAPYYYDWLHHPPEDPYWNFAELRDNTRVRGPPSSICRPGTTTTMGPKVPPPITSASSDRAAATRRARRSFSVPGRTASIQRRARDLANVSSAAPR